MFEVKLKDGSGIVRTVYDVRQHTHSDSVEFLVYGVNNNNKWLWVTSDWYEPNEYLLKFTPYEPPITKRPKPPKKLCRNIIEYWFNVLSPSLVFIFNDDEDVKKYFEDLKKYEQNKLRVLFNSY